MSYNNVREAHRSHARLPADWVIEPCFEDALPDYETELELACANE